MTDWTPILTDSDMTVCLDRPYLGCTFWFIEKFTTVYFLSSCLESEALPGSYLFPCYSEIMVPMFNQNWNYIFYVPCTPKFYLLPCSSSFWTFIPFSPEINVILLFLHILGGSKQTVPLFYVSVNSKTTMHHTRIWLTGKFNTPALGKIEMVQYRAMH